VIVVPLHPALRRPLEFVGFVGPSPFTEVEEWTGAALQPEYIAELGKMHEAADFDRVLLGYGADRPDNWQIAGYLTQQTERLGALVAHRPGFVAPTLRRGSPAPSISSPGDGSRSTSSPAARTPTRPVTATSCPRSAATPAPPSTCRS